MASSVDVGLGLYEQLVQIRSFEEMVARLAQQGEVPGFVHVSIGQEAVAAGVCSGLEGHDVILTGHRGHGHSLAKGGDPYRLMAEILGREDGYCKGRGGSMHLVDMEHNNLGATGVVGGNIPLALGVGWASQITKVPRIAAVFFGDGASSTGTFHESLNLAALWKLPVLLICENNGYAEFSSRAEHSVVALVSEFAKPYGMPARTIDGNDVLVVREATAEALEHIRTEGGPYLLECMTYRLSGHYVGDPEQYRTAQDLTEWKERDPISRLRRYLINEGADDQELSAMEERVRTQIEEITQRARQAPRPALAGALDYVYA